ncbi:prostaglandin F2-alpha receptor isoform X2 [Pelodiscus sinensis]|uniref:prostaglandin F2-alpha receptor isoform X2 n=1 Tax=Pelodiscus sinensis TaxID=13735 RepID=UPI0003C4D8C4|nr:prostaglandin F2-alpha receptor isoform X2 [Pelodiscus sinensis]|eukprot:XP_006136367.1 prostaglandin F2-alpha receptor isoform X2 [Pelodiscus sinensis]
MNSSKSPVLAGFFTNTTCHTHKKISVFFSIIFMTVGILSNSLAIAILMKAYQRFRQKSKASFLLFASGLVITDLFGHLINGTIAVFVYASHKDWIRFNQSNILCSVFGICMVFFGLCPLFLGSVMAVERCIGVTKPIFHSTKMTSKHVKMMLTTVTMANIGINENRSMETCETILFALRMATWNQILDPWVYILLRKAVLKNLYKIARRCCGMHIMNLHMWELSSIKSSLKVAAISESPVSSKQINQQPLSSTGQ